MQAERVWHLVDDESRVLATLSSDVEVLALRQFCTFFVADPARVPEHFPIEHHGRQYIITPIGSPGESLTLLIASPGEPTLSIRTGLVLHPDPSS